jgi:Arc/MetJ family transcription regulator
VDGQAQRGGGELGQLGGPPARVQRLGCRDGRSLVIGQRLPFAGRASRSTAHHRTFPRRPFCPIPMVADEMMSLYLGVYKLEAWMARTVIDLDDAMLALAQQQLGTKTKRDTINRAQAIAAGTSADDRARGLAWLKEHADQILDFAVLEEREQAGQ